MRTHLALALFVWPAIGPAFAQDSGGGAALIKDVKQTFENVRNNILKSAEKMPAEDWSFRPAPEVRTFGQMLAHVADGNYLVCSPAKGEKPPVSGLEKTATEREAIMKALKESFAYCEEIINGLTPANALEVVKFFRTERTRAGVLMFNTIHDMEHYGNLVTYMRMKGIVPPSSEPRR